MILGKIKTRLKLNKKVWSDDGGGVFQSLNGEIKHVGRFD